MMRMIAKRAAMMKPTERVDNHHFESTSSEEGAAAERDGELKSVYSIMALRRSLLILSDKNVLLRYSCRFSLAAWLRIRISVRAAMPSDTVV